MNALNDSTSATPYLMPPLLWGADSLSAAGTGGDDWLWQGFLAPGAVTLLTSQWKTGKSTLVSVLLARMKTGGSLAGLAVAPGKAVVVSEEGAEHWQRRARQLDFGDHVGWFCRPFRGKPSGSEWAAFIGALAGIADILIEMRIANHAALHRREGDRRRRLWAWSGFSQTPARLVIEWSADGTDYLSLGTFQEEEFARHWPRLLAVLEKAPHKLTRKDMIIRWRDGSVPDKGSLGRWLEIGVERRLLKKDGEGLRDRPFRYWLPQREEAWREDPLAYLLMPEFAPGSLAAS
jgi:hypothetical protein